LKVYSDLFRLFDKNDSGTVTEDEIKESLMNVLVFLNIL
jgi:Ca2+-binding EF-hand superfamily protein